MAETIKTTASSTAVARSLGWLALPTGGMRIAMAARPADASDSVLLSWSAVSRMIVRYNGNARAVPAPAAASTVKTGAMAAQGVARRTRLRVHTVLSFRGWDPGDTPVTSPPLAGWKVRRFQSADD